MGIVNKLSQPGETSSEILNLMKLSSSINFLIFVNKYLESLGNYSTVHDTEKRKSVGIFFFEIIQRLCR